MSARISTDETVAILLHMTVIEDRLELRFVFTVRRWLVVVLDYFDCYALRVPSQYWRCHHSPRPAYCSTCCGATELPCPGG